MLRNRGIATTGGDPAQKTGLREARLRAIVQRIKVGLCISPTEKTTNRGWIGFRRALRRQAAGRGRVAGEFDDAEALAAIEEKIARRVSWDVAMSTSGSSATQRALTLLDQPAPTREIPLRTVERLRADGHRLDLRPALFDETRRPVANQREVIADERAA